MEKNIILTQKYHFVTCVISPTLHVLPTPIHSCPPTAKKRAFSKCSSFYVHCCDIFTLFPLCPSYSLFATGIIAMCRNKYLADCPREKGGRAPKNTKFDSTFGFLFIYLSSHKQAARTKNDQRQKKSSKTFICHLPNCPLPFWRKKNPFNRFLTLLLPIRPGFSCSHCTNSQMMPPYGRRKRGWVGSLGIRFIRSSEVGRGMLVLSHLTAWLLLLPQHRKCGCLIFNGLFLPDAQWQIFSLSCAGRKWFRMSGS